MTKCKMAIVDQTLTTFLSLSDLRSLSLNVFTKSVLLFRKKRLSLKRKKKK
jgi:hypothetical protein